MKEYKSYMDRVTVSEEFHDRLLDLQTGNKPSRPVWKKYAAVAACGLLLLGVGAWGVSRLGDGAAAGFEHSGPVPCAAPSSPVEGDGLPGIKTIGGYEEHFQRAGMDLVRYYVLPWIDYGSANEAAQVALDWDIPKGAIRRDLSQQEIIAFLGGAEAVDLHLDWSSYELSGWGAWCVNGDENGDGPFWGAYLQGYRGPMDHFEFAVTSGSLPPTCIAFAGSVEQEIWGMTVTADKYDGKEGCSRRVSFMKDDYGYRFDLTATGDPEDAEKLVSRAVNWIANGEGLNFSIALFHGATFPQPAQDPNFSVGEPNWNDGESAPSVPPQDGASAPSVPPAGN